MALSEARAAWQRTVNRCLVQEDAKRAPKLACCSSAAPSVNQANFTDPTSETADQEIPNSDSQLYNRNSSYSNLSPNTKWWLQLQPSYGYQTSSNSTDKSVNFQEGDNFVASDLTKHVESSLNNHCRVFATCERKNLTVKEEEEEEIRALYATNCQDPLKLEIKKVLEISRRSDELDFHPERAEKNTPCWRTADREELALLVAQSSIDIIENCDLPRPQNTLINKDLKVDICRFSHEKISGSSRNPKRSRVDSRQHFSDQNYKPVSPTAGSVYQKPLRDSSTPKGISSVNLIEHGSRNTELLEALLHSQTRAREAERAAKQAFDEKEHVVKIVLRQASQLFAYKQLIKLLQLENMYFQFKNGKTQLPWTPRETRKMCKDWKKSRKRSRPENDVSRFAVVFALGLGLVGAGVLLGWTIGWILPTW